MTRFSGNKTDDVVNAAPQIEMNGGLGHYYLDN